MARIDTAEDFAAELSRLQKRSGKSFRDLARSVDGSPATLNGWCTGRHLPYLRQQDMLRRFLLKLGVSEHEPWLDALVRIWETNSRRDPGGPSPYRGLLSYGSGQAEWFFGREDLVSETVERLQTIAEDGSDRVAVVVGASGSGKSSLLQAGVCPALTNIGWLCLTVTPGTDPCGRLGTALADYLGVDAAGLTEDLRNHPETVAGAVGGAGGEGRGFVVVVDQFEELFTECSDDRERERFLSALMTLAAPSEVGGCVVVLGVRVDFYAQVADTHLAGPLQDHQVLVGPMSSEEATRAIVEPARQAQVAVEDELVAVLLSEFVSGRPRGGHDVGALPLLSHALFETWSTSQRKRLTTADYRNAGGVAGAVEKSAERVFSNLSQPERQVARQVFLRLVRVVDDDGLVTRRSVRRDEIDGLPAVRDDEGTVLATPADVVERFISARLLTAHATSVEIAHDALMGAWPRFRRWIDEDRDGLRIRRRVTDATRDWTETNRDPGLLARGVWLEDLRALTDDLSALSGLSRDEREFIDSSIAAAELEVAAQRRQVRRLRGLVAVAVSFAVLAGSLAVVASRARSEAVAARDQTLSRQVAIMAEGLADRDTSLARQLAIVAYQTEPTTEARAALIDLATEPTPTRYLGGAGSTAVAIGGSGVLMAVSDSVDGVVRLFKRSSSGFERTGVISLDDPNHDVFALAVTPDERVLAVGDTSATVALWDITNPASPTRQGATRDGPVGPIQRLDISPDGTEMAAVGEGEGVHRWNIEDPANPLALPLIEAPGVTWSVAYSPDGRHIAFGDDDGTVSLWDITDDPAPVAHLQVGDRRAGTVSFNNDGTLLAGGTVLGDLGVWDISDPPAPEPVEIGEPSFASWVNTTAFSPDGRYFVAASSDADLRVWDMTTWQPVQSLPHPLAITQAAFDDHGTLVTAAVDGTARVWDLHRSIPYQMIGRVFSAEFSETGDRLVVISGEDVAVWDIDHTTDWQDLGTPDAELEGDPHSAGTGAISPDGSLLARGSIEDGVLRLYDLTHPDGPQRIDVPQGRSDRVVHAAGFSSDQLVLAAGGDDAQVRLWDLSNLRHPRLATTLQEPEGLVLDTTWSPDGRLLAVASADSHIYLYDVTNVDAPQLEVRLGGFDGEAYVAEFIPDSDMLAAAGTDGTILIWNIADSTDPAPIGVPIDGPAGRIFDLSAHPTKSLLAAGVTDGTTWLWDTSTPTDPIHLATLGPIRDPIFPVALSPTHDVLVASGADRKIRAWSLDEASILTSICSTVGDVITEQEWNTYLPDVPYSPPCQAN